MRDHAVANAAVHHVFVIKHPGSFSVNGIGCSGCVSRSNMGRWWGGNCCSKCRMYSFTMVSMRATERGINRAKPFAKNEPAVQSDHRKRKTPHRHRGELTKNDVPFGRPFCTSINVNRTTLHQLVHALCGRNEGLGPDAISMYVRASKSRVR